MDGMLHRPAPDGWDGLVAGLAALAGEVDRTGSFPREGMGLLHRAGLLGLTARPQDGGGGARLARSAEAVEAVARGCASTALILAMQLTHVAASARGPAWPERLRALVGRGAAGSGALVNALRVEPELGTPARGGLPATVARRGPGGWRVSGRKIYSTGAPGLTWGLVFARTDEDEPRTGLVLVPMDAPGVRVEDTWDHLGLRGSCSHDAVFEDVAVPLDHAVDLRPPAAWQRPDAGQAAWNAVLIGALYTGVARAARDWLVGFLRERVPANLGAPLATLPRVQEAVGRIEALLAANARLIAGAAAEHDRGAGPPAAGCGLIKHTAAENAIAAVEQAVRLAGNHGLSRRDPLERHLRDVLCARVHTPQADAALTAAGRLALAPHADPGDRA